MSETRIYKFTIDFAFPYISMHPPAPIPQILNLPKAEEQRFGTKSSNHITLLPTDLTGCRIAYSRRLAL